MPWVEVGDADGAAKAMRDMAERVGEVDLKSALAGTMTAMHCCCRNSGVQLTVSPAFKVT